MLALVLSLWSGASETKRKSLMRLAPVQRSRRGREAGGREDCSASVFGVTGAVEREHHPAIGATKEL